MVSPYAYAGFKNFSLNRTGSPIESEDEMALNILTTICTQFKVEQSKIRGKNRKRPYVTIRQIAMYFIRMNTGMSLSRIGYIFGWRDHTSVIHSIKLVRSQIQMEDENFIKTNVMKLKMIL